MTFSPANTDKKINNLESDSDEYFDTDFGKLLKGKKRNPNNESPSGIPNWQSSGSLSPCTAAKNVKEGWELHADEYDCKEGDEKQESYEFLDTEPSMPQIRRNSARTYYTAQAPRELINFLYMLGKETKKRNKLNLKSLPDDMKIPSPVPRECSIESFGSLDGSSSDNFLTARGSILSSYSMLSGCFLKGTKAGSAFYPNLLSLQKIDGTFRQSMSSMDNQKLQSESSSNKESVNEILLIDVHSSCSGELKRDEFSDDGRSHRNPALSLPAEKAVGKVHLREYPKKHTKKRRSNSTDFAFSEANEASRIEISTVTSSKAFKEFLIPEDRKEKEDDVESIIMRIMKNHLRCGRRRRIISQSMFKKNVQRYEERRHRINRILWKPSMTLEWQRQAANQADQKPKSNRAPPRLSINRQRIPVINEEDHGSSSS